MVYSVSVFGAPFPDRFFFYTMNMVDQFKTPLSWYVAGISDLFLRTGKLRMIETGLKRGWRSMFCPLTRRWTGVVPYNYIEFRLPSGQNCLVALSKPVLDVKGSLANKDGSPLGDVDNVFWNAAMHIMIKSVSVYFNSQQVEQNPLHSWHATCNNFLAFSYVFSRQICFFTILWSILALLLHIRSIIFLAQVKPRREYRTWNRGGFTICPLFY